MFSELAISPSLGLAVMFNNYFHDVATALLIASSVALHTALRVRDSLDTTEATRFFLMIHGSLAKLFRFSFWWIILGGIPRTIFYRSFEWANAVDKLQVPALIFKHILFVIIIGWGIVAWRRLNNRVRQLQATLTGPI